jgi:hypothetical protein
MWSGVILALDADDAAWCSIINAITIGQSVVDFA